MAQTMITVRRLTAVFLAGILASAAAHADDYRFELGASFDRVGFDDAPDADIFGVGGTFYLKPVPTDGLPLADAWFLNRSSFVNASLSRLDFAGENADLLDANFGYYIPNTIFYGRVGVAKTDEDLGLGDDGDETLVYGTFGITPIDGLLVTTDFTEDGWDANATARYVGKMGNDHYYAAQVSVHDPDDDDVNVGLDFDYYLDHTLSIGGGVGIGSDTVTIRAEKFFMQNFAVAGRVFFGDDGDGLGATVKWRF
jgi:hypothetical protein